MPVQEINLFMNQIKEVFCINARICELLSEIQSSNLYTDDVKQIHMQLLKHSDDLIQLLKAIEGINRQVLGEYFIHKFS